MKYIDFVNTQPVNSPIDGTKMALPTTQAEIMLTMTAMNGFAAGKSGIEQMELILAIRTSIRSQAGEASKLGHWALEDAHAEELERFVKVVQWNPATVESALPTMRAIRSMKSELPAAAARPVEAAPATNGAAAHAS